MHWLLAILALPYMFILISIYRRTGEIHRFKTADTPLSFISVIIPCLNEEKNISALLNDLRAQDYPGNLFEIIVVDDNSTDNTFSISESFRNLFEKISVIRSKGRGKKAALRTGIEHAGSTMIITTDADCRIPSGWLTTISACFSDTGAGMIICPVIMTGAPALVSKLAELEFLALQGITAGTASGGNPVMCNSANLAFRKNVYLSCQDNLHPELPTGDDIFFLHCAKKNQDTLIIWLESEDAAVKTTAPDTFRGLLSQRSRWLSKSMSYDDRSTIILGLVSFLTNLLPAALIAGSFFDPGLLYVSATVLLIKSIPDFLLISSVTKRYNINKVRRWFIPLQFLYPFYVLLVTVSALFRRKPDD